MGATVVDRQDLHVFMPGPALELVFDAQVGEVHLVVEIREVMLERPSRDLLSAPIGMPVIVVPIAVPLVEPLLVLALELVVENDPVDAGITLCQTFRLALVRAVDLGVVVELALPFEARIELLARLVAAVSVRLQYVTTAVGQGDRDITSAVEPNGLNQSLLAKMPEIALPRVGRPVVVVAEISRRHHPERPDDRQGARLGPAKRVRPFACVVDDLAIAASREVDVPREHVARILRPADRDRGPSIVRRSADARPRLRGPCGSLGHGPDLGRSRRGDHDHAHCDRRASHRRADRRPIEDQRT